MLKLQLLSSNMVTIINQTLANQTVAKLIEYNDTNPFSQPDITDTKALFMDKVFPYPFEHTIEDERTELRVYFPDGKIHHRVIEDTDVFFDIIVHRKLYMIKDNSNNTLFRPYRIGQEIVDIFDDKSIGTVGKLHFYDWANMVVDSNFQATRLVARMMTIGN